MFEKYLPLARETYYAEGIVSGVVKEERTFENLGAQ